MSARARGMVDAFLEEYCPIRIRHKYMYTLKEIRRDVKPGCLPRILHGSILKELSRAGVSAFLVFPKSPPAKWKETVIYVSFVRVLKLFDWR